MLPEQIRCGLKKILPGEIKNIVVILGDPNKKDPIKHGGIFDDDDFYTVNELKKSSQ